MSPADLADYADETQNNKTSTTTLPTQNCLSLRYNAACCIPLRHLRYLRENNTQEYSIYCTNETPKSLADHADNRRQTTKQQYPPTPLTTNCLSLRYNAACCIHLRHLRYLRENIHISLLNQSARK